MSEGVQEQKRRQRQRQGSSQLLEEEPSRGEIAALLAHRERASTGGRAEAARKAAPLLVEVYGKLVEEQPLRGGFRPDGILFIYINNLVRAIAFSCN